MPEKLTLRTPSGKELVQKVAAPHEPVTSCNQPLGIGILCDFRHSQRLFFFRNTPGNYSRDQQEQSHEKQIFGITPSDAAIVCRNNDKNLEAVDEVAFTTDGFGISDSRNHQKRKHEHADRQVHV